MPFIDWLPSYNIGHEKIDKQHQRIVELINQLHDSIIENKVDQTIAEVFREIVGYTQYHFKEEENVMADVSYPLLQEHMLSHHKLMREVADKLKKLKQGEKVSVFELMGFLRKWLVNHILEDDRKIISYIEKHQKNQKVLSK